MKHNHRAEVTLGVCLLIAAGALLVGVFAPKPKFFDSRSRDADASAKATADVERRIADAVSTERSKGAVVSASVQQMGVAAGELPDSPQRAYLVREAAWLSPLLPAPDAAALLAAERRRVALLEGKLELADRLYADGTKQNAELLNRAVAAESKLTSALAGRREVDGRLAEAAAYARGKDYVIGVLIALVLLAGLGWLWARVNSFSTKTLGAMVADLRAGDGVEAVFDRYVPARLHRQVRHAASDVG